MGWNKGTETLTWAGDAGAEYDLDGRANKAGVMSLEDGLERQRASVEDLKRDVMVRVCLWVRIQSQDDEVSWRCDSVLYRGN